MLVQHVILVHAAKVLIRQFNTHVFTRDFPRNLISCVIHPNLVSASDTVGISLCTLRACIRQELAHTLCSKEIQYGFASNIHNSECSHVV